MDDSNKYDIDINFPVEIEQYERKIYDLKQLIEISKGLNSTLDYNVLIESILLTCMGHMQLLQAGIFLKKGIDQDCYVLHRNYKGFELKHEQEYEIPSDSNLITFLENSFRCFTMDELTSTLKDRSALQTLISIMPSMVVPLKGKGKLNGIIILGDRINADRFTESEKEYLLNIASLAGIAIQNAYLYEMATTDMMTKLKIHHFFQATLADEREKAVRQKKSLSLVMVDIDHFKKFNDTYGHQCGDKVLIEFAKILMYNVRQIDTAARYGGEEFTVILPGTEIDSALLVAERIRRSVEEMEMQCEKKKINITVSIGVTQFNPAKDRDNKAFIERADKALYNSKQEGRNRVTSL